MSKLLLNCKKRHVAALKRQSSSSAVSYQSLIFQASSLDGINATLYLLSLIKEIVYPDSQDSDSGDNY